jgi:hypothetical protein
MKPQGLSLIEALLGATVLSLLLSSSLYLYQHSRQLAQQSQSSLALSRFQTFLLSQIILGRGVPAQPGQRIDLDGASLAQIWLAAGQNLANPQRYRASLVFEHLESLPPAQYGRYLLTACLDQLCRDQSTLGALPTGQAWGSATPIPAAPGQLTLSLISGNGCSVEVALAGPAFQQIFRQSGSQTLQLAPGTYQLVANPTAAPPPYDQVSYQCNGSPDQLQLNLLPAQTQQVSIAYSIKSRPR